MVKNLENGFTRNQSHTDTRITHAKTKMTATELKVFYQTTTLIDSVNDTEFNEYMMSIKDFCQATNLNDTNRDFIVKTCKGLLRQVFEIEQENGDYIGYTIFKKMHYQHKEQKINFAFNDEMKPYLLQLQSNYTKIKEIKYIREFDSKYAIRIYAMLKDSRLINPLRIEVDKLSEILQLPKSYKDFYKINEKVLAVAITEINQKSDLVITKIEPIEKLRKKITKIAIYFRSKEATKEARKQTQRANEVNKFNKYIGKAVLYLGNLFVIDRYFKTENNQIQFIGYSLSFNTQTKKFEITTNQSRLDFHSIDYLENYIQKAKDKMQEMRNDPSKFEVKDHSEAMQNLFDIVAKKNHK